MRLACLLTLVPLFGFLQPAAAQTASDLQCSQCVGEQEIELRAIGSWRIKEGGVRPENLANGAVTAEKIGVEAVGTGQLADDSVTTRKIAPGAVTTGRIQPGAVAGSRLADGAVDWQKLAQSLQQTIIDLNYRLSNLEKISGRAVVVDGTGSQIGLLVNIADDKQVVDVLSDEGYIQEVAFANGGSLYGFGNLFFATSNCTGQPYSDTPPGFVSPRVSLTGVGGLFFTSKQAMVVRNFSIGSATTAEGCRASSGTFDMWPALLNDPAITGIAQQSYALPITIEQIP